MEIKWHKTEIAALIDPSHTSPCPPSPHPSIETTNNLMAVFYTQKEMDSNDSLGDNYPFKNSENVNLIQQSTTPPIQKKKKGKSNYPIGFSI